MKVLIITYYWPPSGGSGVQRWLKFVKYLPQFGVHPIVFTPENPSFELRDESLLKDVPPEAEVIHFPIWEPYGLGKKISGKQLTNTPSHSNNSGFLKKAITWLRGNFIYPDPRIFWVKPSVQFLLDFIKDRGIDIIITTGPPHSMHLIGQRLKKKMPALKWVADFRDPWSEWGMLRSFSLTRWALAIHQKMERTVLQQADRVITITPFYQRQLAQLSGRQVDLITNGYDEADFCQLQYSRPQHFTIRHVGVVNPECDPRPFMDAIGNICSRNAAFKEHVKIIFTGQVNAAFRSYVEQDSTLNSVTEFQQNVPHHEVVKLMGETEVLLLVLHGYKDGEGFLPGKLFEYLATGRPILGVGPVPGDAHEVLKMQNHRGMIAAIELGKLEQEILFLFDKWWRSEKATDFKLATPFSRKGLTFNLTQLLNSIHHQK